MGFKALLKNFVHQADSGVLPDHHLVRDAHELLDLSECGDEFTKEDGVRSSLEALVAAVERHAEASGEEIASEELESAREALNYHSDPVIIGATKVDDVYAGASLVLHFDNGSRAILNPGKLQDLDLRIASSKAFANDEEPNWKHQKLQALLSMHARKSIELKIFDDIFQADDLEDINTMMEYWTPQHDIVLDLRKKVEDLSTFGGSEAACAAIEYALKHNDGDAVQFLRLWNEGEFDALRKEWDDVPDAVFIGADPLFKKSDNQS